MLVPPQTWPAPALWLCCTIFHLTSGPPPHIVPSNCWWAIYSSRLCSCQFKVRENTPRSGGGVPSSDFPNSFPHQATQCLPYTPREQTLSQDLEILKNGRGTNLAWNRVPMCKVWKQTWERMLVWVQWSDVQSPMLWSTLRYGMTIDHWQSFLERRHALNITIWAEMVPLQDFLGFFKITSIYSRDIWFLVLILNSILFDHVLKIQQDFHWF